MTTALIFDPIYSQLELPAGHRFPVQKYQSLYNKLCSAGVGLSSFIKPEPITIIEAKCHLDPQYIDDFAYGDLTAKAIRKIGFPWSEQLVKRTFTAVGGTILAGEFSLRYGKAINLSGGYHHAFYDYGSGYCIVNDLYLSAVNLLNQHGINRVLIFDCDVHQGDGTAQLAAHDSRIFTVSIHSARNFPFEKQRSDLDIELADGIEDCAYLQRVEEVLELAGKQFKPDAIIYDAGVDIHCDDELGHLNISLHGVFQRDRLVFQYCRQHNIPVSAVIGGGYQRNIAQLVDVHFQLFRAALEWQ